MEAAGLAAAEGLNVGVVLDDWQKADAGRQGDHIKLMKDTDTGARFTFS